DDDASIRWVLEKALSNAGFKTVLYENADDVLAHAKANAPDVIVTDIRMPGTSGLELLDQAMRRDALIPAATQGAPRTATEISMAASQAYALLQSQAIQKASMFSSLLQHWCAITGEPLPVQEGPALLVEISPLAPSPKPQPTVSEMLQLQERGIISEVALRLWLGDLAGITPATA
ncbi:MAG: response regulator, partial [Synechococcaceae bacterium WB9_4xC_028]|nr:response regulator [Synechococcaceae bacterium WB9_4xC_028]